MSTLPTVCILAGGRGTRLGSLVEETPKPLLKVAGEPFLVHQLRLLARHGARRAVLCVGYRGELIEEFLGKERFGVELVYSYDGPELEGTLGAIRRARQLLPDSFLVLYGDTYLRLDYGAAARRWVESRLPALMVVFENGGRWDRSNAVLAEGLVVAYDKQKPLPEMRWIDYGLGGLHASSLDFVGADETDLANLYGKLASHRKLCGYEAQQRFYEIGSPAALAETDAFLRSLSDAAAP